MVTRKKASGRTPSREGGGLTIFLSKGPHSVNPTFNKNLTPCGLTVGVRQGFSPTLGRVPAAEEGCK